MKLEISDGILVYSPPVNEQTKKWGVYAIPRMWRLPSGELIVRFNGELDSEDNVAVVSNLYFLSKDNGKTWSKPYSIIGKTLEEERADGRNDFDSKYGDSSSYSNTFIERISDNSAIVLYNDLRYDPGKAAFVKIITLGDVKNAQNA